MKKTFKIKSLITALCAILVIVSLVFTLTACGDGKTDVPTTESTSTEAPVSTTETVKPIEDEETETTSPSTTEEVVETEAPTQKPTEAPKPTEKPDVEFEDKPAGSGGIDWSGWDPDAKPDTNHVGGESSDEVDQIVQDTIDKNGWDMDWELN